MARLCLSGGLLIDLAESTGLSVCRGTCVARVSNIMNKSFVWRFRSRSPRSSSLAFAVSLLLLALLGSSGCLGLSRAQGQEPAGSPPTSSDAPPSSAPPSGPPSDTTLREQTIYIPYRKLQQVFEKEGRGVFLPYDKFQALWKAAQHRVQQVPTEKAPYAAVIREIESLATLGAQVVEVESKVRIEVLRDGWVVVPLRLGQSAIRSATVEGQPARIVFDEKAGYQFVYRKEADSPDSVELVLQYVRAFDRTPGRSEAVFHPPRAPIHRWEVVIDEPDVAIEIEPKIAATRDEKPGSEREESTEGAGRSSRVVAFVGAAERVAVRWNAKAQGASGLAAFITAQVDQRLEIVDGAARSAVDATFEITRAPVDHLELDVPSGWKIVSVADRNLKRWTVAEENGRQRISLELFQPVTGKQPVSLRLEKFLADPKDHGMEAPLIRATQAGRQSGTLVVATSPGLKVEVLERSGLYQVAPEALPESWRRSPWSLAYRYAAIPYGLKLEVAKVQPRVSVRERTDIQLSQDELRCVYRAAVAIADAGLFQLELEIPEGYAVESIRGVAMGKGVPAAAVESYRRTDPQSTLWEIHLAKKALGQVGLEVRLVRRLEPKERPNSTSESVSVAVDFPRATGAFLVFAESVVVVHTPESLRVNPVAPEGFRAASMDEIAGLLPASVPPSKVEPSTLAFWTSRDAKKLTLRVSRRKPQVNVREVVLIQMESGVVRHTVAFSYDIRFSGISGVRIDLPESLAETVHNATPEWRRSVIQPPPEDLLDGYVAWRFSKESEFKGKHELRLTWEEPRDDLRVGSSSQVDVPRLVARGVDHAAGWILVAKSEGIDIEPKEGASGLRPIDPERDVDPAWRLEDAAMAFEFVGDWKLSLVARRYEPAPVTLTAVERGVVRAVVLPNGRLSIQAIYRVKSARQRLALRFPKDAEFDARPIRIDGTSVVPEQGTAGKLFVPLAGHDPNTAFVLEARYSVASVGDRIPMPAFDDDVALEKVYLAVYVPERLALVRSSGLWSFELTGARMPWDSAEARQDREIRDLLTWVCDSRSGPARRSAASFPVGRGRRYVYSALRPSTKGDDALSLVLTSQWLLQGAAIGLLALLGLPLIGRSIRMQITLLLLIGATIVLLGVLRLELLEALLGGIFPGSVAVLVLIWIGGGVWKAGRRGQQTWRRGRDDASPFKPSHSDAKAGSEVKELGSQKKDDAGGPNQPTESGDSTDSGEGGTPLGGSSSHDPMSDDPNET